MNYCVFCDSYLVHTHTHTCTHQPRRVRFPTCVFSDNMCVCVCNHTPRHTKVPTSLGLMGLSTTSDNAAVAAAESALLPPTRPVKQTTLLPKPVCPRAQKPRDCVAKSMAFVLQGRACEDTLRNKVREAQSSLICACATHGRGLCKPQRLCIVPIMFDVNIANKMLLSIHGY